MELTNTQLILIVILVLALLFILGGCSLSCNGSTSEGWTDQVRDAVSNPYFGDIFSNCQKSLAVSRSIPCSYASESNLGNWDRSEPLSVRSQKITYARQAAEDVEAATALRIGGAGP